jgi:ribosome-associated toxin RatA of RatAB toxin-antitoxin module
MPPRPATSAHSSDAHSHLRVLKEYLLMPDCLSQSAEKWSMRTITLSATTQIPIETLWQLMTDIAVYPSYVTFVQETVVHGPVQVGTRWGDTTTILWIPLRMKHTITRLEGHEAFAFELPLWLGGTMTQEYRFQRTGDGTLVLVQIRFDLGNTLVDAIIGPLLERRLRDMVTSTFEAVKCRLASADR